MHHLVWIFIIHARKDAEYIPVPTRIILQSYISSHKSDMFKCESANESTYLTPPYACSYTHSKPSDIYHHYRVLNVYFQPRREEDHPSSPFLRNKDQFIFSTPRSEEIGILVRNPPTPVFSP